MTSVRPTAGIGFLARGGGVLSPVHRRTKTFGTHIFDTEIGIYHQDLSVFAIFAPTFNSVNDSLEIFLIFTHRKALSHLHNLGLPYLDPLQSAHPQKLQIFEVHQSLCSSNSEVLTHINCRDLKIPVDSLAAPTRGKRKSRCRENEDLGKFCHRKRVYQRLFCNLWVYWANIWTTKYLKTKGLKIRNVPTFCGRTIVTLEDFVYLTKNWGAFIMTDWCPFNSAKSLMTLIEKDSKQNNCFITGVDLDLGSPNAKQTPPELKSCPHQSWWVHHASPRTKRRGQGTWRSILFIDFEDQRRSENGKNSPSENKVLHENVIPECLIDNLTNKAARARMCPKFKGKIFFANFRHAEPAWQI